MARQCHASTGLSRPRERPATAVDHDFPNLAHAVAVQSTIGKGRIRRLDASAAEKMPGVLLVLHHGNIENVFRTFPRQEDGTISETRPPFEDNNIYYWGQFIALVVAETLEQAKAAANAVRVEYETKRLTCARISALRSPVRAKAVGNVATLIRPCPKLLSSSMKPTLRRIETHNPMEMHGTVAVWDGDNVTLYEGSQGVVNHRTVMSEVLGVPRENVRIISRFIGSGFGGKLFPWPQSTLAAVTARKLNRPVKLSVDRRMMFSNTGPSSAYAAAYSARRDAGWEAHRDPPRLPTPRHRSSTTSSSTAANRHRSSTAARI